MKNNLFFLYIVTALVPGLSYSGIGGFPYDATPQERWTVSVPDDTVGAIFYDDFQSLSSDQWLGDTASFDAVGGLLRLVEQARSPAFIAVPSNQLRNTEWEVGVVATTAFSATNYIRLYVAATTPSFLEPQWGYHLQIDGTETHHVYRLWRQNGVTRTVIFESNLIPNLSDEFSARIRVTCTEDRHWQILTDEYGSGSFQVLVNKLGKTSVKDDTYSSGPYCGYFVSFSPARWRDFKLDYLLIKRLDPSVPHDTAEMLQPGDILINEVLSNPKSDGVDFLEVYNYSNKTIDLAGVSVARVNTNGTVGLRQVVSDAPLFLYPNEYKVLTRLPEVVKQHYPNAVSSTLIEMAALPNFNNETGGVVIYGEHGVVDSLFYTPAMQSPFMTTNRGVSLERQHFSAPTHAPGNFRSAAITVGGATPGYQNSRYMDEPVEDHIFFTSKTFSPDNDGFEDQLEINYRLPESGFMANIDIYTDQGRLIKRLVRNQSMATQGTLYWDGLSDANTRLPIGMYVAVIEVYNADGIRKVYRRSFVLAARL